MTDEEIAQAVSKLSKDDVLGRIDHTKATGICRKIRDEIQARTMATIAEKDAKIYAYEAIIANSNFKAVLPKKKQEGKK